MIASETSFPLRGRTILVTRTEKGNRLEKEKLESLGATVVELTAIEIRPPTSFAAIDAAISNIDSFDWIIFTSANGVISFFQRLEKLRGDMNLNSKFACVGPQTEAELRRHGAKASFIPKEFLTESLGEELSRSENLLGKKVLLARAESANKAIKNALDRAGAIVTEAPVYRTVSRKNQNPRLLDGVTDITLTSPSTVEGLLASVGAIEIFSREIKVHCIGPVTAQKARALGLRVDSVANVHTIEGLTVSLLSAR